MEKKMKKILSLAYSLKLKNIILFLNRGLIFIFFPNGYIHNVVSMLPNVKFYVENGSVVSTLSNVVQINIEMDNLDSTLSNVVSFNVDVHNIVSTLIWRCPTSRRHINLKTTLTRRWNVCWVLIILHFLYVGPSYGRKILTGYIKHKANLTIAEERVGAALKNTFPRNAVARRQGTSRAVNPMPYRADYFSHKLHIKQNEKLDMYGVTYVTTIDGHSRMIVLDHNAHKK